MEKEMEALFDSLQAQYPPPKKLETFQQLQQSLTVNLINLPVELMI